jgi:hypothetical protein
LDDESTAVKIARAATTSDANPLKLCLITMADSEKKKLSVNQWAPKALSGIENMFDVHALVALNAMKK